MITLAFLYLMTSFLGHKTFFQEMKFNLIICTFQRPKAISKLLDSVYNQTLMPSEILVIDGSHDEETRELLIGKNDIGLRYFKVGDEDKGLTLQRNYGLEKTAKDIEIICFLDDDTVLEKDYFQKLIDTYKGFPDAIGVGGYIVNEIKWDYKSHSPSYDEYKIDGWSRKLGSRNLLRKKLGLLSNQPPGVMPVFSHGLSTGFLPPSGRTYPVEYFMGGVASYKRKLFEKVSFSRYFDGYGLYEDMEFCLRASRNGQLYLNTAAQVHHYHEKAGRPKSFNYGKMVIRNGWYVWRVKYPKPTMKAKFKWVAVSTLLLGVRIGNIFTADNKQEVLFESVGRLMALMGLLINKPRP